MTASRYAYSNASGHAGDHHTALAELLDGASGQRVGGLLDLAGKRCLEVGAGGGSFALWLAEQVGPTGTVLATDITPRPVAAHPRLTVIAHDVTTDAIPEAGSWDVIHARLLLNHLPERRKVLAVLAAALAPGGYLVTEDFWSEPPASWVAFAPDRADRALLRDYHTAVLKVLDAHGNSRAWAAEAYTAMREEGLVSVETTVAARSWPGGGPGARLLAATLNQTRGDLIDIGGLDPAQLDRVQELLGDPDVVLHGHRMYTTSGRKPIG
ncbi:class I SAM-dependent methyltransferase [Dactylosporangium sp. CA-092794]|uniref:class I SAM-dependent methyltransferase n=1 Tax=Dactylosporangium sp. CA-092794 TaxID=3239929 RepID=UPI003D9260A4